MSRCFWLIRLNSITKYSETGGSTGVIFCPKGKRSILFVGSPRGREAIAWGVYLAIQAPPTVRP